ncbi:MAG: hypothetical protein R2879_19480 [Saprospiraceae bacterium]
MFLLVMSSTALYGQVKYEKESRMKEKDVPKMALDFINSLEGKGKVKWYLEEGLDQTSVEAKFKLNRQKHSIEFDTTGNLEDAEIQLTWKEISPAVRDSIDFFLGQDCKKYKIRRIQIQYSGEPGIVLQKIKTGEKVSDYAVRYELIVKCRKEVNVNLYEYLFSESGQKLSVSQIVFKNSSHLEY